MNEKSRCPYCNSDDLCNHDIEFEWLNGLTLAVEYQSICNECMKEFFVHETLKVKNRAYVDDKREKEIKTEGEGKIWSIE